MARGIVAPPISTQVAAASTTTVRAAPGRSNVVPASASRVSGTATRATAMTMAHNGTLIRKIQGQLSWARIQPPMNGPIATAIPDRPAQTPIAGARSSGWKLLWIIASPPGVSNAAPMPCRIRAATRSSVVGASAHAREAIANQVMPIR